MKLTFYHDPGHDWLKVPFSAIKNPEACDRVSRFSYVDRINSALYLEEDCDILLAPELIGMNPTGVDGLRILFKTVNEVEDKRGAVRSLPTVGQHLDHYWSDSIRTLVKLSTR